jgi:hypothetical protein
MNANTKITVKYLGPTNTRGSRYRVTSDQITALPATTVSRDYDLHHDDQVDALIDQRIKALVAAKVAYVQQQFLVAGSGIEADRVQVQVSEVVTFARAGITEALVRIWTEVRQ